MNIAGVVQRPRSVTSAPQAASVSQSAAAIASPERRESRPTLTRQFSFPSRAQKARKAARNGAHRRIVKRYRFILHASERHTAHVAAVLQFAEVHIPFLPEKLLSRSFYRAARLFASAP